MKINTSELVGPALDWAVAVCQGISWEQGDLDAREYGPGYSPSTNWAQGGEIIEREKIDLTWDVTLRHKDGGWTAIGQDPTDLDAPLCQEDGPTPLVAAMRCYVASRLGDEVDVPEELK